MPDDAELDGCDGITEAAALKPGEDDLFVLFAEALDPNNPVTVEQVAAEWAP